MLAGHVLGFRRSRRRADRAAQVADHLLSDEMFSGWGIRTLATSMACYNPISYHNGSVWPHDNAICASGLMRYGFVEHAQQVATAILEAASHFGHRLPELYCGYSRSDFPAPVPYPTSCSPQAWAAAAPWNFCGACCGSTPNYRITVSGARQRSQTATCPGTWTTCGSGIWS